MRILYDHQAFSMQSHGGISRYFCEIAARIPQFSGDETRVLAPLYVNEYLHASLSIRKIGMKVPKLPGTNRVRKMMSSAISCLSLQGNRDVDIFHETYYARTSCAPVSSRRVITVYDMIHERFPQSFPANDSTAKIKARAARRADHVICISESTRRDLLSLVDIPIEKTSVIHLGSALTVSTELANEPPLPEPPYLLYVGARNFYKNFAGLLRALARSPELLKSFRLVCFGGGGFTPSEKSMIASLGLPSDAVRQLSGNDRLLSKLYSHASVFICPSLYEGFGIPVLEAMSQGCPVVCSDTSSLPEVAGNAAEYFAPEDPDAMLAAIERVINSPARAQQLTALGYERVKLFSWDRCASQTLDAYRRLLGVR